MNTMESVRETIQGLTENWTNEEREKVIEYYLKEKIIRINKHDGGWRVIHGAFLADDVLENARKITRE